MDHNKLPVSSAPKDVMRNFVSSFKYICDRVIKICRHTDIHTERQTGRPYNTPLPHRTPHTHANLRLWNLWVLTPHRGSWALSPFILLQKLDICTMFCLFSHKSSERNYLLLLSPITSKINKNKLSAHLWPFYIFFFQSVYTCQHKFIFLSPTCLSTPAWMICILLVSDTNLTLETIMLPQHNMLTNITVTQKNAVSISVNFLNKVSFKFCIIQFT